MVFVVVCVEVFVQVVVVVIFVLVVVVVIFVLVVVVAFLLLDFYKLISHHLQSYFSFLFAAEFKIVDPFPENIYPLEFSSAEVTCVAFDSEDPTVMPAEITFVRRNMFGEVTDIKPDENIHFTSKTEGKRPLDQFSP